MGPFLLRLAFVCAAVLGARDAAAQTPSAANIRLEAKISLGDVTGRIDHMAADVPRRRLFVAELGNNTVGVVDLDQRKVVQVIRGLHEPQGVAYLPRRQSLLVTNAGDGSVRVFTADDNQSYRQSGRIDLGEDADNIRLDKDGGRAFIGYGSGALGVIDTGTLATLESIRLKEHPESFQLSAGGRVFINVPKAGEIAVVDGAVGKQIASWPVTDRNNFPMALDEEGQRVLVAFRNPPVLSALSMRNGEPVARRPTCADADDLFVDPKRSRVYVSCGEGMVDILDLDGAELRRIATIPTAPGARTSLFVPELDRLFVAAPARSGAAAAILVFTLD